MIQRLLIQETLCPHEIAKITDFLFLSGMTLARSWSAVCRARIQAFTFFHGADSQDHVRLPDEHMSKHSHNILSTGGCCGFALQKNGELWV